MKLIFAFILMTASPVFATLLGLSSVKQVTYLHASDEDVQMRIIDVPFVTAYADPEWRFSAISKPFVPPSDGSWRDPSDINLASIYGIVVSGTYKENGEDVEAVIDLTKAKVPKGYPFTLEEVTEQVKRCVKLMYPFDPKVNSKLEIRILKSKN